MVMSILLCLGVLILVASFVVSIFALRRANAQTIDIQEKIVIKDPHPAPTATPADSCPPTPTSPTPPPVSSSDVFPPTKPVGKKKTKPDIVGKPQKKKTQILDESKNIWVLEASGTTGAKYNIQVEWSDLSSDIESGSVPEEETFVHKKGVVPVKVVGIPPNGDVGVEYSWKLNGFHWS